jgi:hypothetical protein
MRDLTRKCLDLSKDKKQKLVQILTESLEREHDREDDGSRFSLLYKAATDICGLGILTRKKDFNLVMGRRVISYKMRQEGYSYPCIGKYLRKDHTSIIHGVKMMQEAFDMGFDKELAYWYLFNQKVEEYEKEISSEVV